MPHNLPLNYKTGQLVYKPHLLSSEHRLQHTFKSGEHTITELVDRCNVHPLMGEYIQVYIDGYEIEAQYWKHCRPKECHLLIAAMPMGGGGGGKSIFRLIAVVALSYFTFGAGALFVGGGAAAFVGNAAVFIAGSLAIQALFPPPELNIAPTGPQESPTHFITGQKNKLNPGGAVARIYGKHLIYPTLAAQPYTQTKGRRHQFLHMLFDCGYGPLKISDMRIGKTALSQFRNVSVKVLKNATDGGRLRYFIDDISTEQLGITLKQSILNVRTTEAGIDSVDIDITFPRGLVQFTKQGKKDNISVTLNVKFRLVGETQWRNFGAATSYTFSRDVNVNTFSAPQFGHNYDASLPFLLAAGIRPTNQLTGVAFGASAVQVIGNPITIVGDYDKGGVTGAEPQQFGYLTGETALTVNMITDAPSGSEFYINGEKYTLVNSVVAGNAIVIDIDPPLLDDLLTSADEVSTLSASAVPLPNYIYGGNIHHQPGETFQIFDATIEPFNVQMHLVLPDNGQYDIQVIRETSDFADNEKITAGCDWVALRSFKNGNAINFPVPHTIIELRIKASDQLKGVIDTFTCIASSELQVWDGAQFNLEESRSPAWATYDALTGTANSQPLPASMIDIDQFFAWANFCEQQAGNANETRFLCDAIIDGKQTLRDALKNITSTGRGSITSRDGKYSVIFDDEPTIPIQLITTHNSWAYTTSKTFVDPPHALRVGFVDPDANWQKRDLIVFNDGFDESNAVNFQSLSRFGCTRHTQAYRDGRYDLAQSSLRLETTTISMDIENIVCQRGDFVLLQHDVARIGGLPDRIKSVAGAQIETYEPFTLDLANNTYQVRIREPNNDLVTYSIVSQVNATTIVLNASGAFEIGNLIVWGITNIVTDEMLVLSVVPSGNLAAKITLVQLARPIYGVDTGAIPPYEVVLTPDLGVIPPLVTDVTIQHEYTFSNGRPLVSLVIAWQDQDEIITAAYEVYFFDGQEFILHDITDEAAYSFFTAIDVIGGFDGGDVINRQFCFKILALGPTGFKHELEKIQEVCFTIPSPPRPDDVQNFNISVNESAISLDWDLVSQQDIQRYEIRYAPETTGFTWEISTQLILVAGSTRSVKVNARIGSYGIKAVNALGDRSVNATFAVTQIPNIFALNFIESLIEDPTFLGIKDRCEVQGGQLVTSAIVPGKFNLLSRYSFFNNVDLGRVMECRVSAFLTSFAAQITFMTSWADITFQTLPNLIGATNEDLWDSYLEVRTSDAGALIADWLPTISVINPIADLFGVDFGEYRRFYASDITGQIFQFRLVHTAEFDDIQVITAECAVEVDMIDRVIGDDNVTIPIGGTRILFNPEFRVTPAIAVSIDNIIEGDFVEITNADETGFDVQGRAAGGAAKAMQIDFVAKGYGETRPATLPPT